MQPDAEFITFAFDPLQLPFELVAFGDHRSKLLAGELPGCDDIDPSTQHRASSASSATRRLCGQDACGEFQVRTVDVFAVPSARGDCRAHRFPPPHARQEKRSARSYA